MRVATLALLFLAVPAAAQSSDVARAEAPPLGHRLVLIASAVGGTTLSLYAVGPLAPLTTAPIVYGTGYLLGHDAPFGRVAVDWAVGSGVGFATYLALNLGNQAFNDGASDLSTDLGIAFVGMMASTTVTALLYEADRPVSATPVTLRLPDGSHVAGLSLRVGL